MMSDKELGEGVLLLEVERHPDMDAIHVKVYEAMEGLNEVAAGIILADIARNLEQALDLDLAALVETFQHEMGEPTGIPVQPS